MIDQAFYDERHYDWTPRLLGVLRIVSGLTLLVHGASRILGPLAPAVPPGAMPLAWTVVIVEVVGGALLVLGIFTRPVAFVLLGEMATVYWAVHAPVSPVPALNGVDVAVLHCAVFLVLALNGPGA